MSLRLLSSLIVAAAMVSVAQAQEEIYVVGVGMTRFGRLPDQNIKAMTKEAVNGALSDAAPAQLPLATSRRVKSLGKPENESGGHQGRRSQTQAKLMFWSRSGTERMRLPVAAK